jgi:3-deoxy-manno-octulosonate cytidylyltransferase (CMP-KDO synthetase)
MKSPSLNTQILVVIPARMEATRLPGKPLCTIEGIPLVVHAWRQAMKAVGNVIVACDDQRVYNIISSVGGKAVMTSRKHVSGSDRVWEAVQRVDRKCNFGIIVNLQVDLPFIDPKTIRRCIMPFLEKREAESDAHEIATLATPIKNINKQNDPNVVKVVATSLDRPYPKALYFTRARVPWGDGGILQHIGLYVYTRDALSRFIALPPSPLEKRENLEQLRALEAGMRITICFVKDAPQEVNTQEDLDSLNKRLGR